MAYEICSGLVVSFLAIAGIVAWFRLDNEWDYESVDADKIHGRSLFYENHIAIPMLWYQTWNAFICLVLSEYRDAIMIAHHVVTVALVYLTFHPFLQYYGMFFFGMPEVTSVPLIFIVIFKHFPGLKVRFADFNWACRWVFGVLFLAIRLGMWSWVSVQYWMVTITILRNGTSHSVLVHVFFMAANVFLTTLQWIWGSRVVTSMIRQVSGSPSKDHTD